MASRDHPVAIANFAYIGDAEAEILSNISEEQIQQGEGTACHPIPCRRVQVYPDFLAGQGLGGQQAVQGGINVSEHLGSPH